MGRPKDQQTGRESTQIPEEQRRAMRDKAERLTERDTPSQKPGAGGASSTPEEEVYRPEANVDNQKSPEGTSEPGLNTSIDKAPYSGAQVKEKTAHKKDINDKAERAKSDRRNG